MILLLGGTSETAPLTSALLEAGHRVLVSTATNEPLALPDHPCLQRRHGRLPAADMAELMRRRAVRVLLDATHPYASQARKEARQAAVLLDLPYIRWERPNTDFSGFNVDWAEDHIQSAHSAFAHGRPVLLTTGSRHLEPYVTLSRRTGIPLRARVLPHEESRRAVERAGLNPEEVIWGKGPFSLENNRRHISENGVGVLVTKDSGEAGGVPEKLQAARMEQCRVIVVRRPVDFEGGHNFCHLAELLSWLASLPDIGAEA